MSSVESILLGVLSGVVTAALLSVAAHGWKNSVVPWFKQVLYQGVELEDTWTSVYRNDDGQVETEATLVLAQKALDLSGQLHIRNRVPGNHFDMSLVVQGRLWEGYVSLILTPANRKSTATATGLLKVLGAGAELEGVLAIRHAIADRVASARWSFARGTPDKAVTAPSVEQAAEANADAERGEFVGDVAPQGGDH